MTAIFESRDLADSVAEKLKVYAQPQRLMILSCLLRGERNVAEIGEATGIGQPALSQQLAELRRAELVSTRKKAKQVWYGLAEKSVVTCVETMEAMFCGGVMPTASAINAAPKPPLAGVASFARVGSRSM
jgi:DNA-binding transcriptional ArsR family regulator